MARPLLLLDVLIERLKGKQQSTKAATIKRTLKKFLFQASCIVCCIPSGLQLDIDLRKVLSHDQEHFQIAQACYGDSNEDSDSMCQKETPCTRSCNSHQRGLSKQSVKPQLRKVRACNIKTIHSHGIQESAHLVFFT